MGVSPEMNCITLNGVDWIPTNFIPQNCVIDFVPRFQTQSEIPKEEEEDANGELMVSVNLLDQIRVWKSKTGFEWSSFKGRVDEIADGIKWSEVFGGKIWEDDSRTPEKNTTITVNMELPGGDPPRRLPSTQVQVRIEDREPFPLGLIRGNEWDNFRKCMNLVLKMWSWTAMLRGEPWTDNERKPLENDEIQVRLTRLRAPIQGAVHVFVKIGTANSQIVHLQVGNEWAQFCEWIEARFPADARWSAAINGRPWEDQSFATTKDRTIRVDVTLEGGGKKTNKVNVWVKLGNRKK
jgi:hypothetical protein